LRGNENFISIARVKAQEIFINKKPTKVEMEKDFFMQTIEKRQ
jgi:hypothetical protein